MIIFNIFLFSWMVLITWWGTMFGHLDDSRINPPMKIMKFCSLGNVSIIRCNYTNHLNEHTIVGIKFGGIMPWKSNETLINAIFHNVAEHCSLFPLCGADLLPANMKHHIQLHLLTTASVLNAAMAMIISIDANDWDDITWGVGQFSGSGGHHYVKNTWNERSCWALHIYSLCIAWKTKCT